MLNHAIYEIKKKIITSPIIVTLPLDLVHAWHIAEAYGVGLFKADIVELKISLKYSRYITLYIL